MKRLAIAAVGLALVAAVMASACGGNGGDEDQQGHYENAELGFTFDYPSHWEQLTMTGGEEASWGQEEIVASIGVGTLAGEDTQMVNGMSVRVVRGPMAIPQDEFEEWFEAMDDLNAQLARRLGGAVEEKDWTELGGVKARRYVIYTRREGVPVASEQVIALRGDLEFVLLCEGERDRFQEVRKGCQVVLDTFQFTSKEQ